jgi:hypothetical protein
MEEEAIHLMVARKQRKRKEQGPSTIFKVTPQ